MQWTSLVKIVKKHPVSESDFRLIGCTRPCTNIRYIHVAQISFFVCYVYTLGKYVSVKNVPAVEMLWGVFGTIDDMHNLGGIKWKRREIRFWMEDIHLCDGLSVCNICTVIKHWRGMAVLVMIKNNSTRVLVITDFQTWFVYWTGCVEKNKS